MNADRNDAPQNEAPRPILRADYRAPDYWIDNVRLEFVLDAERTVVRARLDVRRALGSRPGADLVLDGEDLELLSIRLDGAPLAAERYEARADALRVRDMPPAAILETEVAINPSANTALSGLYLSSGMFCTQCEAEGFRRITYYLDRPDVLAKFSVRIEADAARHPILLANGNPVGAGALAGGRHFAEWADPFPKPAYLFALVAGDLAVVTDQFVTRSGREIALKIFVRAGDEKKCGYALDSLKRAMRWDEEAFGREYDLDLFMIVAVDHFNFGAMENKGLNIFNAAYVLASPETATDADYEAIESVVAHEYFHNWSGNRVTCRDWFQLCLKEGFTVFRDQEFSADMRSRPVQRIKDVRRLWSQQFPEDDGPLAHPVRPDSYLSIDNFYTATVYEKGAELCRMLKTLLGPEKFRAGADLYFARHDGTAATVDDFLAAMADASGRDLRQFARWYSDAGAPTVSVTEKYDAASGAYALDLAQSTKPTPGQDHKPPRHIPIAYALYGAETGRKLGAGLIELTGEMTTATLGPFTERPVASLLDGYSAPVKLARQISLDDRLRLAASAEDLFSRWSIVDELWRDLALAAGGARPFNDFDAAAERFIAALRASLFAPARDAALTAELLKCPSASDLLRGAEGADPGVDFGIDPDAVTRGRQRLRASVGQKLAGELSAVYDTLRSNAPFAPTAEQAGERALKNAALALLAAGGASQRAAAQAKAAANMTDEAQATAILAAEGCAEREEALERFYDRWKGDPLVVNKWLAMHAATPGDGALAAIDALTHHDAYDAGNPNRVRSLLGVFARENVSAFHAADGSGYEFLSTHLGAIDRKNPQLAARLATSFEIAGRLDKKRREAASQALRRLTETKNLSTNLREIVGRILGADGGRGAP